MFSYPHPDGMVLQYRCHISCYKSVIKFVSCFVIEPSISNYIFCLCGKSYSKRFRYPIYIWCQSSCCYYDQRTSVFMIFGSTFQAQCGFTNFCLRACVKIIIGNNILHLYVEITLKLRNQ